MVDHLTLFYLPTAVGLGALHALEPGHSKTLMAAYLIGTKGTKRDALLLGLSAATTHSLVVVALAVTALWLGSEVFTDRVSHWLQIGSGLVVILLGLWMLWRRWPRTSGKVIHSHGAPDPIAVTTEIAAGTMSIVDTPDGERMRFVATRSLPGCALAVHIARDGGTEIVALALDSDHPGQFTSGVAPAEPHAFEAAAVFSSAGKEERHSFVMHEPEGHHHDHDNIDDDAHALAHAAAMPEHVKQGVRPSVAQVIAFGAAGGMIPCPASITVMLLALSIGQAALGVIAVLCFSLGLAITLVGIGLVVVAGVSQLARTGRFSAFTRRAPLISAALVVGTGIVALTLAH